MAAYAKSDVSGSIYGKVTSLLDGYTKNALQANKHFKKDSLGEPEISQDTMFLFT